MRGTLALLLIVAATPCRAQEPEPASRAAAIEQEQTRKADDLHPYVPNRAEKYLAYAEQVLTTGVRLHPFFDSAYSGGGFTLGAGYRRYLGPYNNVDVRGSLTVNGYKRIEAEFVAPRLFNRRGVLSAVGGWREATSVGYYGLGTANSKDERANYGFRQPYASATLDFRPRRQFGLLRGGLEASEWQQTPGRGDEPSVDEIYTPETLPGLGASVAYIHTLATAAIDTRFAPGYARRGGYYGVTYHDYTNPAARYGFSQIDYEALQHVPILHDVWVLSFHGLVSTTGSKADQQIPFFMLPSVGGGSSLRAFSSWRFRDRNSLTVQAEWRVIVNRFVDMAVFYDAGKVTADTRDLNLKNLKNDFGLGFRFHGPLSTPFRVEFASGNEGFNIVWAASAAF